MMGRAGGETFKVGDTTTGRRKGDRGGAASGNHIFVLVYVSLSFLPQTDALFNHVSAKLSKKQKGEKTRERLQKTKRKKTVKVIPKTLRILSFSPSIKTTTTGRFQRKSCRNE